MDNVFTRLLDLLEEFDERDIPHELKGIGLLGPNRSIRIDAYSPGRIWEIDLFENGDTWVQEFSGQGVEGPEGLERLYQLMRDDNRAEGGNPD